PVLLIAGSEPGGQFLVGLAIVDTDLVPGTAHGQTIASRAPGRRPPPEVRGPSRAGRNVPEGDPAVLGVRGQPRAIRAPGEGSNPRTGAGERGEEPAGLGVPDPDGRVTAATGQAATVRTPGDFPDRTGMAAHGAQETPRGGVPGLDGPVV